MRELYRKDLTLAIYSLFMDTQVDLEPLESKAV